MCAVNERRAVVAGLLRSGTLSMSDFTPDLKINIFPVGSEVDKVFS